MAAQIPQLSAEARSALGTRNTRRLRKTGRIPGVLYGHELAPEHVTVQCEAVLDLVHHHAHLIELGISGNAQHCLIKDLQWDYLGTNLIHVDLERVNPDERVTVSVGVTLVGEAVGLKEAGAFLEHPTTEIEIECKAIEIPEFIKVDISELKVGDLLCVSDLKLPAGVDVMTDEDAVIAAIHIGTEEVVEAAPAEGAAAEPELIGRKPEEGEAAAEEK